MSLYNAPPEISGTNTKRIESLLENMQGLAEKFYNENVTVLNEKIEEIEKRLEEKVDKDRFVLIVDEKASKN